MTDIDAALVEQILDSAKGQREPDIKQNRQSDNLTARFEIAKWVRFTHPPMLLTRPARLKLVCSDRTPDATNSS